MSLACAHAAAAAAKKPLWKFLAGDAAVAMPVPQIQIFGGGAHAHGSMDVQDFMIICTGAGSFAESLEWTAQVYQAAGARLAKRGALHGVADEGGYWPAFKTNEEALAELTGAIADAGFEPGADIGIALDIAATQLWRDGRYHLALEKRIAVRRAAARDAAGVDRALPDRLDRGPVRRARRGGDGFVHADRRRADTDRGRRFFCHECRKSFWKEKPTAPATPCCSSPTRSAR